MPARLVAHPPGRPRIGSEAGAGSFTFSLETSRRESVTDNAADHGIGFRATARW